MLELNELEELDGVKKLPADAAGAWASLDWLSRCHYSPVLYFGKTIADSGTRYWFLAEQLVIFPLPPVRRLVLMSISEKGEDYAVGEEPALVLAA